MMSPTLNYPVHCPLILCQGLHLQSEVHLHLSSLKIEKSPGPDLIHPRIMCELRDVLVSPLIILFSQSMKQGTLPDDWKTSTVTPVFKKGRKDSLDNYRPISCVNLYLV